MEKLQLLKDAVKNETAKNLKEQFKAEAIESAIQAVVTATGGDLDETTEKSIRANMKETFSEKLVEMNVEFDEEMFKDIEVEINNDVETKVNEAKLDIIPEELKVFLGEDGKVDNSKIEEINLAIADKAERELFDNFKNSDFIKGIEGAEVSKEAFDSFREILSPEKFEQIVKGELKDLPFGKELFVKKAEEVNTDVSNEKALLETIVPEGVNVDEFEKAVVEEATFIANEWKSFNANATEDQVKAKYEEAYKQVLEARQTK